MRNLVGQLIGGKYRVTRHVGVGGIAEVYEAAHEQIGQRFALKVLRREFADMKDLAERMVTEARAASAVGHAGIVQVFDIGKLESGEPYIVMELLQGDDLLEILRRRKRLPFDQAVGVCLHVLDALGAAHKAGVLHRDMKPENVVLVRGPGGEPWAKIIDFGIARLNLEDKGAIRHTAQGTMVGTPYYVSPEQARCLPTIDGRSDLYAVGVMLFEMVTGKLPFDGGTATEIVAKVLSQPFPSPRTIVPELPPSIEEIILRATARDRAARYQTAQEFAQALRAVRGELVAGQVLDEDDPEFPSDEDPSVMRRLDEIASAVTAGERVRASVPPPTRPSGGIPRVPSSPQDGRRPSGPSSLLTGRHPVAGAQGVRAGSVPPPPPRMSSSRAGGTRGSVPATAGSVALPARKRPAFLIGAAAALAVVVAAAGVFLLVRSGGSSGHTSDTSPPALSTGAAADAAAPAVGDVEAVPAPVTIAVAMSADAGTAVTVAPDRGEDAAAAELAPPPPATAVIRLVGMPAGATATVDDEPVAAEFELAPSDREHLLRVTARGRVIFSQAFTVSGDLEIRVEAVRRQPPAGTRDGGASVVAPPPPPPPPPSRDGGAQPLANPFP
ncbi:MAG: serine/threonine protein kinase [Deltaproteobacteria bacterium]|nr:serine/threonine protein kinase [Deltaproteobacteria bacterium]